MSKGESKSSLAGLFLAFLFSGLFSVLILIWSRNRLQNQPQASCGHGKLRKHEARNGPFLDPCLHEECLNPISAFQETFELTTKVMYLSGMWEAFEITISPEKWKRVQELLWSRASKDILQLEPEYFIGLPYKKRERILLEFEWHINTIPKILEYLEKSEESGAGEAKDYILISCDE